MDYLEIVGWVLAAAGVAAAVYFKMAGKTDDDKFFDSLYGKQQVAREAVAAVQQLWQSGQIPEDERGGKNALFLQAGEFVREYYPGLTDAQLEMTIEAAVFWLKKGAERVEE